MTHDSPSHGRIGPFYVTQGIHNLRDYGGYATSGGGRVKAGLLFRSGQHMEASDADLDLVHALDIRTVIDLRGNSEREGFPCSRHATCAAQVLAVEAGRSK